MTRRPDTDTLRPLFTWRTAICDSDLAPTTRHVALTLALYMNERGGSAHPGPTRLAHDTGLSLRAVKTHLAELVTAGWLVVLERGGLKGEHRRANVYEARIPPPTLPVDNPPNDPQPVHDVHPCTTFTGATDDAHPCISRHEPVQQVHPMSSRTLQELIYAPAAPPAVDNNSTPAAGERANTILEAMTTALGRAPRTRTETARWTDVALELAAAEATPELIHTATRRWRELYNVPCTPGGLRNQWSTLTATTAPTTTSAERTCPLDLCAGTGLVLPDDSDTARPCPCTLTGATR